MTHVDINTLSSFVWSIAEILRGDYKQSEYGKVVLPFTVLRRLDCVLADSKETVLKTDKDLPAEIDEATREMILFEATGQNIRVYNTSRFTFDALRGQDPGQLHQNLVNYIMGFSHNVREVFTDRFLFTDQLKRLYENGLLYQVFDRFCQIDLHPGRVDNVQMGYLFEELIRRFSEISNETAGEHFTPREVVRLMVDLVIANDDMKLKRPGIIRQVYDPAAGTGGMLTLAEVALKKFEPNMRVELYGQEINAESFAICKSDMLVTGHNPEQIAFGNSLTQDAHTNLKPHYMLTNPPYGVDWKKYEEPIREEHATMGMAGRFGAGLPRVSDGQLLFLQHMISKMRDDEDGSRIAIVMNGSPLFTGGTGSGESEIRRWLLEQDLVEAIIALPTDLFYNTGIQTYIWLLTNRKAPSRVGKVQLIDASGERFWQPMRKSLGNKRREIPESARNEIVRIYANMLNGNSQGTGEYSDISKVFATTDFGYREIRVERPLRLNFQVNEERLARLDGERAFARLSANDQEAIRAALTSHMPDTMFKNRKAFTQALDKAFRMAGLRVGAPVRRAVLAALAERDETADVCVDKSGNPEPDPDLRDHELVPLGEDWREYVAREVTPFVPDAWVDESYVDAKDGKVGRVGYEINFNRYFYKHVPPRSVEEINAELRQLEAEIASLLAEVVG